MNRWYVIYDFSVMMTQLLHLIRLYLVVDLVNWYKIVWHYILWFQGGVDTTSCADTTSCVCPVRSILHLVAQHLVFSNKINTISSAIQSGELVAILLAFLLGFIYTKFFHLFPFTRLTVIQSVLYWNNKESWKYV